VNNLLLEQKFITFALPIQNTSVHHPLSEATHLSLSCVLKCPELVVPH